MEDYADEILAEDGIKYLSIDESSDEGKEYLDAIKDENVLKFGIEYVGRYKQVDSANEMDIDVEGIDTKELLERNVLAEA